ncbi:hypothetical protein NQ318_017518 [Aromia moschata]|uniref:Tubulin--tyrosine ligase-like protein 12 SET-like domain-containing protein n=1 Tax=Aromia moschata TaxID=1265417 RepID=A0AAV8Z0U3_9CUCU|nr:hypothetical protein NQ318_017518 [Aromia moschata]
MGHTSTLDAFLTVHKDQLIASNVPQHFWYTLHKKLVNQTFDAGCSFQIVKLDYEGEREDHEPIWALQTVTDVDCSDPKNIFLIDHAWTYQVNNARQVLLQHDSLRHRLQNIFNLSGDLSKEVLVEKIFENTWKISNTYSIGNAENVEDRLPIWYIMDEIGTAVLHNDTPNCRVVPFIYINEQVTYSLLFPTRNLEAEELVYRDFAEGVSDLEKRSAILLPWVPRSFEDISLTPPVPDDEYFLSGHVRESLPVQSKLAGKPIIKHVLKVFTQYSLVTQHLTDNKFVITEDEDDADILWYTEHFKDFETLSESPDKFVNQFPFEYVITVKDLLCITCRKEGSSKWLPTTYNLLTEIPNFVSCFQQRQNDGLNNFWIVKPYNLARGLDIHITNNLNYIMRIATTGPKIAQKYITDPVLFHRPECNGRVKFDIRYVVLLRSVRPLKAYVYKNFFLRFANVPFELNEFDNYEKHFTVMNYTESANLKHLKCDEFKVCWEQQYGHVPWDTVEKSILIMLRQILESATEEQPPRGIASSPQSRALYAADLMLEWTEGREIKPQILEMNFTPDCKRACDYYPDFFNDIFHLLFLDNESEAFIEL